MKKHLLTLTFVFSLILVGKAQFVTIPDAALVTWLSQHSIGICLTGNQLDTTCPNVSSATSFAITGQISNYSGIEYFRNLNYLSVSSSSNLNAVIPAVPPALQTFICSGLHALPPLPATLKVLVLNYDSISSISSFPPALTDLKINYTQVSSLPALPVGLQYLDVSLNPLTTLPALPATLKTLNATANAYSDYLTALPTLPATLEHLDVESQTSLTSLPTLPAGLKYLGATGLWITSLPALPANLDTLFMATGSYTSVPTLNANLKFFSCWNSLQITSLPPIPAGLQSLYFGGTHVTVFPTLPAGLKELGCENMPWTSLPAIPAGLTILTCYNTSIATIPPLPSTIRQLLCGNNSHLTSLPNLPDTMKILNLNNTPHLFCLPLMRYVQYLDISQTGINCLPPGFTYQTGPPQGSVPHCNYINANGCGPFGNVNGKAYFDGHNNCTFDSIAYSTSPGVKVQLYNSGLLQQQTFTTGTGTYSFYIEGNYGTYTVQVDTSQLPLSVHCPGAGYNTAVVSANDTVITGADFGLVCKPQAFDVGVNSLVMSRPARPGTTTHVRPFAGDMSQIYGGHCISGISGQVQVTFTGAVTFAGPDTLALTPTSVNGNTITWTVADFANIVDGRDFNFKLNVDTSAILGSLICITVTVTPVTGDNNPLNNTITFCFPVRISCDPNEKEVYPKDTIDVSQKWLTYTIHFQNTGNAPAQNIYVRDTLDTNVDPASFQLLATSHKCITQLFGNAVVFNFLEIELPDSATNTPASTGWAQYKVKLKDNLAVGTHISNTASIYFDYNSRVQTNAAVNTIASIATGSATIAAGVPFGILLYPNPASSLLYINTTGLHAETITLYNISGQKLLEGKFEPKMDVSNLSPGVYFIEVKAGNELARTRWVKM